MTNAMTKNWIFSALTTIVGAVFLALPVQADHLAGFGDLSGKITNMKPGLLTTVHAVNTAKNIRFMVYAINGEYNAVNLYPGEYEVTVKPALDQVFTDGFVQETKKITIKADQQAVVNFALKNQKYAPTYVGGMAYTGGWADEVDGDPDQPVSPNAVVEPYNKIFPPGRGRDVLENVCMGCHTPNMFSYNHDRRYSSGRPQHDKDGWAITVDRMADGNAFGVADKASYFDKKLLPDSDRDILVDYLATNFGIESKPRVVQLESEPELDEAALAKAQFVEYRFPNNPQLPKRGTHTPGFDQAGNVYIFDRPGAIVKLDPRTGEHQDFYGVGAGESLVVDLDGTVWYGGVRHFDPSQKKFDQYFLQGKKGGVPLPVSTQIFDSNGDLWMSLLSSGGMAKWERKTDQVTWWDVPLLRTRPYGLTLDHNDKVWFAEYHASSLARFDPLTGEFKRFAITDEQPTNMRRLSADSNNMMWTATWGSRGYQNGAVYRLNPQTGAVKQWSLGISYANPYDVAPDSNDNMWIATDNYIVFFDVKTEKFVRYPQTSRTDTPRLAVTEQNAVWFGMRNAGHADGYGGTLVALYADKSKITTYAARYSDKSVHSHIRRYTGPMTKVTGATKLSPGEAQNPGAYAAAIAGAKAADPGAAPGGRTLKSGATVE